MPGYLLIESRDPFEGKGFSQRLELAAALIAQDAPVTFFLVENGVLAARRAARVHELEKLARSGVAVLADEFALRERGIPAAELAGHIRSATLDLLVERLGAGAVALWN
jgi:sulfur relay (sulfurtransferase) complex TusBCD TusD component (DsrE family)